MLSRLWSAAVSGIDGYAVQVELDLARGLPRFATVGLPDSSIREARERVIAAVRNSGYEFPNSRVTVNLAPAKLPKAGTHLELPIGLGLLMASGQCRPGDWLESCCVLGELSLDGRVRPVSGVLPMAAAAKARGCRTVVLPKENAREASLTGLRAIGVGTLGEAAGICSGTEPVGGGAAAPEGGEAPPGAVRSGGEDLADVKGQFLARRALEVAAAGGHNILFVGPPGTGKSMLARRLPSILPPLTPEEAVEVTTVHSVAGRLHPENGLMWTRPFRAPHPTASTTALVGGGALSRPGEMVLAHRGVLFYDELPEFRRDALEALRQPLEDRTVTVARLREAVTYPADFMFVAAMNPCPCGWLASGVRECRCAPSSVARYRGRLSGPLLDRIDLQVELSPLSFAQWSKGDLPKEGGSAEVRRRVLRARAAARERSVETGCDLSARVLPERLRRVYTLDARAKRLVEGAAREGRMTPRSLDRLIRVARTIADLNGEERIGRSAMAEALQYRALDKETPFN